MFRRIRRPGKVGYPGGRGGNRSGTQPKQASASDSGVASNRAPRLRRAPTAWPAAASGRRPRSDAQSSSTAPPTAAASNRAPRLRRAPTAWPAAASGRRPRSDAQSSSTGGADGANGSAIGQAGGAGGDGGNASTSGGIGIAQTGGAGGGADGANGSAIGQAGGAGGDGGNASTSGGIGIAGRLRRRLCAHPWPAMHPSAISRTLIEGDDRRSFSRPACSGDDFDGACARTRGQPCIRPRYLEP